MQLHSALSIKVCLNRYSWGAGKVGSEYSSWLIWLECISWRFLTKSRLSKCLYHVRSCRNSSEYSKTSGNFLPLLIIRLAQKIVWDIFTIISSDAALPIFKAGYRECYCAGGGKIDILLLDRFLCWFESRSNLWRASEWLADTMTWHLKNRLLSSRLLGILGAKEVRKVDKQSSLYLMMDWYKHMQTEGLFFLIIIMGNAFSVPS